MLSNNQMRPLETMSRNVVTTACHCQYHVTTIFTSPWPRYATMVISTNDHSSLVDELSARRRLMSAQRCAMSAQRRAMSAQRRAMSAQRRLMSAERCATYGSSN